MQCNNTPRGEGERRLYKWRLRRRWRVYKWRLRGRWRVYK